MSRNTLYQHTCAVRRVLASVVLSAILLAGPTAKAGEVVAGFVAVVSDIDDFFCGCVSLVVGDTLVGFYVYDTALIDSDPDTTRGTYDDFQSPHRFVVYGANVTFASDPLDPWIRIKMLNTLFPGDNLRVQSYRNLEDPFVSGQVIPEMSASFGDTTGLVLESDSLFQGPPVEAHWTIRELRILGSAADWSLLANIISVSASPPTAVERPSARAVELKGYPNPFNPTVALSFALASRAQVQLTVYDISGRHVTTLLNRSMSAGPHEVRWDGRNASGAPVSSGVYFATLVSGGESVTQKLVLVR